MEPVSGRATRPTTARLLQLRRRARQSPLNAPVSYALGGVLAALIMVGVDAAIGEQAIPGWLRIGPSLARSSLVGLVTSFLFVVSVVFWVRVWAVQMSAQPVMSRVLTQFLTDRVQRHSMGFIIGAMTYGLTVVRAVPQTGAGMDAVPHLAVTLTYVLAAVVAVIIVFAIDNAARWGQVGRLIRRITDRAVATIRATHPVIGGSTDAGSDVAAPPSSGDPDVVVDAHESGWVRAVDEDLLLDAAPGGATMELGIRVGSFVLQGSPLASVWTDQPDDVGHNRVRDAVTIGVEPSFEDDVPYSIGELVDIAERSMTGSSSDSTTAREAALHLGVVLRELLLRDLPPVVRVDERDRRLLRSHDLGFADYLDAAFGRLRMRAGDAPGLTDSLLTVIRTLIDQLEGRGLESRQALLHEQARLLVDDARETATSSEDRDRAIAQARARRLLPPAAGSSRHDGR